MKKNIPLLLFIFISQFTFAQNKNNSCNLIVEEVDEFTTAINQLIKNIESDTIVVARYRSNLSENAPKFYAICWVKNEVYNFHVIKNLKNGIIVDEEPKNHIKELILNFWLKEIYADETPVKNEYIIDNSSKFHIFYNLNGKCRHIYYNKGNKKDIKFRWIDRLKFSIFPPPDIRSLQF